MEKTAKGKYSTGGMEGMEGKDEHRVIEWYYANNFPVDLVHTWAARGWAGEDAHLREWGIETTDAVFVRYETAPTPSQLRNLVMRRNCGKLNLGAFYKHPPSRLGNMPKLPLKREFVIDIDLTDFALGIAKDDIPANDRAWPLIAACLTFIRRILEKRFGYKHILPVYSGRRGGHLWVCDEAACALSDEERGAMTEYLMPWSNKEKNGFEWNSWFKSIRMRNAFESYWLPFFKSHALVSASAGGLGLMDETIGVYGWDKLARKIDPDVSDELLQNLSMASAISSSKALKLLERYCVDRSGPPRFLYEQFIDVVMDMIGPRIDANVSTKRNHTLKCPFSIHPGGKRVSVPVFGNLMEFKPTQTAMNKLPPRLDGTTSSLWIKTLDAFGEFIRRLATDGARDCEEEQVYRRGLSLVERVCSANKKARQETPPSTIGMLQAPCDRLAWKLARYYTVCTTSDGLSVDLTYNVVESCQRRHSRIVIPAHAYPQFETERLSSNDTDKIVSEIESRIMDAFEQPGVPLHAFTKQFIVVVDDDVNKQGFGVAHHKRLDEKLEMLLTPSLACTVDICMSASEIRGRVNKSVSRHIVDLIEGRI